jgi:cation diffusion facilitator CzcD-associated flavoprotein CzcO
MRHYDVIIIGAGITGMYQLHALRQQGMSVRVFEAGTDVGGTWYWNRYPGACFDSETFSYCYSFSKELLQEWDFKERFESQPEFLKYLQHVADKFDLRRDIEFSARVSSATYNAALNEWVVKTKDGRGARSTFVVTAIGALSAPFVPKFRDLDSFKGRIFHTTDWPKEPSFTLSGKRVAVIGTGSTGVQVIQEVAKVAKHLTVLQKDPNWVLPQRNAKITPDEMKQIKSSYPAIFAQCRQTSAGFVHAWDPRNTFDVSEEERTVVYEALWTKSGFGFWFCNFLDLGTNAKAAQLVSDFVARKMRERIHDPKIADMLIPKDHLFGTRRVPLETNYLEVYNQPNVALVDTNATTIERFTPRGILIAGEEREFDVVILATGFDAVRGAFDRIDVHGVGGQTLWDKWSDGPVTYMGLQMHGFPNLFTPMGPHNAGSFCNQPRCSEMNVEFITPLLCYARERGYNYIEATGQAEQEWTRWIYETADQLLYSKVDSWFNGANVSSVEGRSKPRVLVYTGDQLYYRQYCSTVIQEGYRGFEMKKHPGSQRQAPVSGGAGQALRTN